MANMTPYQSGDSKSSVNFIRPLRVVYFLFQYTSFPESGKRFFASKIFSKITISHFKHVLISNSDSPHVFTSRGVIFRKNFENFFTWVASPIVYQLPGQYSKNNFKNRFRVFKKLDFCEIFKIFSSCLIFTK